MKIVIALMLALPASAYAQDWINTDAQSKGLGNAGIALSEGPAANYYNPANLSRGASKFEPFTGGFGFGAFFFSEISVEGPVLKNADRLVDLFTSTNLSAIQTRLNSGTATAADIRSVMNVINEITNLAQDQMAVIGQFGFSGEIKLGTFGVFYRQMGYATIVPKFDLSFSGAGALSDGGFAEVFNTIGTGDVPSTSAGSSLSTTLQGLGLTAAQANELAFLAEQALGAQLTDPTIQQAITTVAQATVANTGGSSTNTIYSNNSGVEFVGIRMTEIGISLGMPLPILPIFNAGIAVKEITGETFYSSIKVKDMSDGENVFEDLLDEFDKNTKRSSKINFDLGLSFDKIPFWNFGVVYKNVLPMEFSVANGANFRVKPQLRGGASFSPLGLLKIAADIDLLENRISSVNDYRSRMLGGGVMIDPKILPVTLRLGGFDNVASTKAGFTWTGGLGVKFLGFYMDITGQMAAKKTEIESSSGSTKSVTVPNRVGFGLVMGFDLKF